tara:strand:- start:1386 stop:2408 length:1023 start_codon:yes stop_codon:yes gene_type:complete
MAGQQKDNRVISSEIRDSIYSISLSAFGIGHPVLKSAKLVKNTGLETVLDFGETELKDIGMIGPRELLLHFDQEEIPAEDMNVVSTLAGLPSLDCYTIKRALAPLKIKVEDDSIFSLSPEMKSSLFPLMSRITRPLIQYLYADERFGVSDTEALLSLIRDTEPLKVRDRLDVIAANLSVSLTDLPTYLEEFGELFLSVSFFESIFMEFAPKTDQLLAWAEDGIQNSNLRNDPSAQSQFAQIDRRLRYVKTNLQERFKHLSKITQIDWEELSSTDFKEIQREILAQQANLGVGLCGLVVKATEWENQFPSAGGSPQQCLEFLSQDLNLGLDNLTRVLPEFG